MSRPVKMSEKSAIFGVSSSGRLREVQHERDPPHLERFLVLEHLGDSLARLDPERVASEPDLAQIGDLFELVQVGLDRLERVKLEDEPLERVHG